MICDVCNDPIPEGGGVRVKPEVFSRLLDNGIGVDEFNVSMLTEAGMSREQAITALRKQYLQSSSDWMMCGRCAADAISKLVAGNNG